MDRKNQKVKCGTFRAPFRAILQPTDGIKISNMFG